jgi:hypothetical protein
MSLEKIPLICVIYHYEEGCIILHVESLLLEKCLTQTEFEDLRVLNSGTVLML